MIQSFGQIFEIIDGDRGKNYPQDKDFSDTGFCLFLSAANVTKNGWKFDNNQFISKEKCEILRKGLVSRGDIVFTTRGTVGNVALYDDTIPYDKVRINSGMIILREKETDTICNKFAYYLLKSKMIGQLITYYCSGSAQPQLPIKDFSKIKVDIPSLSVQKEIASILSNYDTLIDINTKRIKILEETARELYKEWFVRMRFPGHEKKKFVKGIPEGWKLGCLDDISTLLSIKVKSEDVPIYVTTDNMLKDFKGVDFKELTNKPEGKVCFFEKDDILMSNIRPYFKKLWYANQQGGCSADVLVFRANKDIDTHFLYYTMCTDYFIDHVVAGSNGTKMPRGNKVFTMKFPVLIPSKELMGLFHQNVSPIYATIETLQLHNQELTATRDRLLPRLLSGELKVKA